MYIATIPPHTTRRPRDMAQTAKPHHCPAHRGICFKTGNIRYVMNVDDDEIPE